MNTRQRDRHFLARDYPAEDLEVLRTEGSYVIGSRGRKYVDFFMGWCVGNLGWANPEILRALRRFQGPTYVTPDYLYGRWVELAERLAEIAPGKLRKTARATGGTEAVEFAMQATMSHTRRRGFLSLEGSYHGNSIATLSIGSSGFRKPYWSLLPNCHKVEPPLDAAAAEKVETRLKKRDIAAFILEPISCNLGVLIPERAFMVRLQELCRKYGTLLVMDEVATGFGRTGRLFASEHFGLQPDILCLGKAISGGHGPMGATIMTDEVAESMEGEGSLYSTYAWHPSSVEAAIANVRYFRDHGRQIHANTRKMSEYFAERLAAMKFKYPAETRIKGLAIGVEFKRRGYAEEIGARARKGGLLISVLDEQTFGLFPALNIPRAVAKRGLDILERSL